MADAEESGDSVRETIRTVTPSYHGRPDEEMDVIGIGIFLGLLVLLVPLLPFLLVVWVISKVLERGRRNGVA